MKETLSNKQMISLMSVYLFSSSVILTFGAQAKQDAWIAILFSAALAAPLYFLFARIMKIYSGMNMFEIILNVFGKLLGKMIILLYTWFSLHLGAQILIGFASFIKNIALIETPVLVILIVQGFLCIYFVKAGVEVKGRYSEFIAPMIILFILFLSLISIKEYKINNLTPILYEGLAPVFQATFSVFTNPYSELFLVTLIITMDKKKNKPYKIYFLSLAIGTSVILLVTISNILVLGGNLQQMLIYPSYIVTSIMNIGDVFQRMEAIVAVVYLFGGFVENSIFLNVASSGLSRIFNIKDYKTVAGSVGLIMIVVAHHLHESNVQLYKFIERIYPFYSLVFLVILPVIICVVAEIKYRISNKGKTTKIQKQKN